MAAPFAAPLRRKVIIDTDPGVDDTFAILLALRSPEIEVIGLTSLFGNVRTPTATKNALHLLERFGRSVPVYEGHLTSIAGDAKERIADFVHGDDGFREHGCAHREHETRVRRPRRVYRAVRERVRARSPWWRSRPPLASRWRCASIASR